MIAKLIQVTAEHTFSTCPAKKLAHGTAREVRHISFGGCETKPSKRRVLFFRESNTDFSGSRIQDWHVEFRCGPEILDRDSYSVGLTNFRGKGRISVALE
jgi:hypothetical protein